jgi:hypothetical protein
MFYILEGCMSASITSAKSKRGKLVPLPKNIRDAINEVYEAQRKLKMEPVNESILFQSQEAKDGFQQADVVLTKGTLYEDFTKEEDKRLQEQERQRKVKESYDTLIARWNEDRIQRNQYEQYKQYTRQKPTNSSRGFTKMHADQTSRANHDRVVNGLSNRVDDHMRVAEITHEYMTGQHRS